MARYIDADLIKQKLQGRSTNPTAEFINTVLLGLINNAPTANVAPIADTVKKMKEMLKQTYDREHIETGRRFVSLEIVDLVAKIMLEGINEV